MLILNDDGSYADTVVLFSKAGDPIEVKVMSDGKPALRVIGGPVDFFGDTPVVVDFEHHQLHKGRHFFYTDFVALDNAAVQTYLITVPVSAKFFHMLPDVEGISVTTIELFEGCDRIGTALETCFNSQRNSSNTPELTVHKGVSGGSTDGVRIHAYKGGSATGGISRIPAGDRGEHEIILKANTCYLLKITSGAADNVVNVELNWYEVAQADV